MASTICPDNSTSCLLRALLNDNTSALILESLTNSSNEYNWDPLTFAFTVAIGVLAFIVALVTVFQGCLAAGPGRLKAGYQAIGPWRLFSRSEFNWYQLAVRTTAETPFIDSSYFESKEPSRPSGDRKTSIDEKQSHVNVEKAATPANGPFWYRNAFNQFLLRIEERQRSGTNAPYNASWLNLLMHVSLADPSNFESRRTWYTDYIGDSLQATPAYGLMKTLAFLTIYANDSSLIDTPENRQSRLYGVRGLTSDLVSQDLDTMEPAAAYVSYGSPESFMRLSGLKVDLSPKREDMTAAFQLFNGRIPFGTTILEPLGTEGDDGFTIVRRKLRGSGSGLRGSANVLTNNGCPLVLALCLGDVVFRPRAFPKKQKGLLKAIDTLAKDSMWRLPLPGTFWRKFTELATRARTGKGLPKQKREWRYMPVTQRRKAPFLKLEHLWRDKNENVFLVEKMGNVKMQKESMWNPEPSVSKAQVPLTWDATVEIASVVYVLTRTVCCRLKDDKSLGKEVDDNKSIIETIDGDRLSTNKFSIMIQNEILCVDHWLRQQDLKKLTCALLVLIRAIQSSDEDPPETKKKVKKLKKMDEKRQQKDLLAPPRSRGNSDSSASQQDYSNSYSDVEQEQVTQPSYCFLSKSRHRAVMRSAFYYLGHRESLQDDDNPLSDDDESDIDELKSNAGTNPDSYDGMEKVDMTTMESEEAWSEFWNIVEVWRYRALLYSAMLDLCVDSSPFGEGYTDFAVKII